jgi:Flp pilus assembly pilin Flp
MERCMTGFCHFFRDEKGASTIEYGLLAAGIAIAIVVTLIEVGSAKSRHANLHSAIWHRSIRVSYEPINLQRCVSNIAADNGA